MSDTIAPMTLLEASRLEVLEPAKLAFTWHGAHLRLTIADRASWPRVAVLRCFPLGKPNTHWSVRDAASKEIGVIFDPAKLDADSRAAAQREVDRRYVITGIRRILSIEERYGICEWEVETDRGRVGFSTRNSRDSAVRPSPGRWLISDVEGRRFEIRDVAALDQRSASLLLLHL
jgi:hypothetical protein